MYIIGGTASKTIAMDISKSLCIPLANTIIKRFPDKELYVRIIDDISDEDVIIIQTTYPDENIIELFLLQDAVKEAGANKIIIIIPYFGYGRQDKKFKDGESISAKAIANIISINADDVLTIDPHKEHILDFFQISASSCSAVPELAKHLKNKNIDLVLAPDKGALDRTKNASKIINCDYDFLDKTRINGTTIEIKPKNLNVNKKNIAIIDDIVSTGGTMAMSIKELKKFGAKKIFVVCSHGLFAGDAINKLISAGCNEIIATDTIESKYSKVKTAPIISKFITSI